MTTQARDPNRLSDRAGAPLGRWAKRLLLLLALLIADLIVWLSWLSANLRENCDEGGIATSCDSWWEAAGIYVFWTLTLAIAVIALGSLLRLVREWRAGRRARA
jgi:hypothetical protein